MAGTLMYTCARAAVSGRDGAPGVLLVRHSMESMELPLSKL